MTDLSLRIPLRFPTAGATFAIGIAGYLGVNLSPYMISALQTDLGLDVLAASWVVTAALLATAITGLVIAPLCAGRHRRLIARIGLTIALIGFLVAALIPVTAVVIASLVIGGAGAGTAVASSGAALAAFRNPDRVAGLNGLANRGVVTIVLAIIPVIGLAPIDVFGALALFALIALLATGWLPAAPVVDPVAGASNAEAMPIEVPTTGAVRAVTVPSRTVTISGFVLLATFALWAISEDSLWAMAGVMGFDQAGLTPEGLGLALSGATAGGIVGSALLMVVGNRLGRAVPLAILLVAGGALKIAEGFATDQTSFIVVFILWNTVYAIAFMYFVSTSAALDADGRWSGPLLAIYLVGSALTPVIGAALVEALGYQGFVTALGVASFVLAVPAFAVAAISSRTERSSLAAAAVPEHAA
ncbi:MFS transporter [Salinibacterium sp. NK8237]|uniref:MFS transporter n=1 Tax=Salinibacterium sp. NK8237 TaxID=2792038 RepID=UPI0018CF3121|nr:MFS transporter [Salinibacterium sp. NK8237]MBH0129990.1 MFS transporter [Salinibacterium sp. NK8237]